MTTPFGIIGRCEWVHFSELEECSIKAKIDTGADTSALHAWKIQPFQKDGQEWVRFEIHPKQKTTEGKKICEAPVLTKKDIKSSNGQIESRFTIRTPAKIGPHKYHIDLTLTNRDEMGFRMLLGRKAIKGRFLVDCAHSFLQSHTE